MAKSSFNEMAQTVVDGVSLVAANVAFLSCLAGGATLGSIGAHLFAEALSFQTWAHYGSVALGIYAGGFLGVKPGEFVIDKIVAKTPIIK